MIPTKRGEKNGKRKIPTREETKEVGGGEDTYVLEKIYIPGTVAQEGGNGRPGKGV